MRISMNCQSLRGLLSLYNLGTVPTFFEIEDDNPVIYPPLRHGPLLDERLVHFILVDVVVQIIARCKLEDEADLHVLVERFLGDLTTAFDAL